MRFLTIGTCLAIRDNQDEGWPVPMLVFDVETMEIPMPQRVPVFEAWSDIDGNSCTEGELFSSARMSLNRVPIYKAVNDQHKAINLYLIGDKDWFTDASHRYAKYRKDILRLTLIINACEQILGTVEEFSDG